MEEKGRTKNQSPVQNSTPEQTPPVPETPKAKPKLKFPILILGVVAFLILIGIVSASIILNAKQKPPQESKTIVKVSPTPDSTANWKTYTNSKLNFTFNYPDIYQLENEDGKKASFSQIYEPGHQVIPSQLILHFSKKTNFETLKKCTDINNENLKENETYRCSDRSTEINSNSGVKFRTFDLATGGKNLQEKNDYIAQTVEGTPVEFDFNVSGGGLQNIVNSILSTFKFTDQNQAAELGDFPIFPGAKFLGKTNNTTCMVLDGVRRSNCSGYAFEVVSPNSFKEIYHWYKDNIQSGWKCSGGAGAVNDDISAGSSMTICQKGAISYSLSMDGDTKKTELHVEVPPK